eukprot:g4183.t1
MQTAQQYWKPGEKKPLDEGSGPRKPRHKRTECGTGNDSSTMGEGKKGRRKEDLAEQHSNSRHGKRDRSAKRRGKNVRGKDADNMAADVSQATARPPAAGPSQGLLAMKFMQRKVKADEAQKQQQEKRDKFESDFSSSYAKRLKAAKTNDKDRLICRIDEQDPALVVVGRRSFGGFNAVAEAAYDACVRDIAAGERLEQLGREGRGGGISDAEMAETLGKSMRVGRR